MTATMADIRPAVTFASADDITNRLGTGVLDGPDRDRAARISNEERRRQFIAGRALVRHRLTAAAGHDTQPEDWRFAIGPYGKPRVAPGLPQINFSVSHANGMIAIATSSTIEVGIDLEPITGTRNTDPVTDQLSLLEQAWLQQQAETDRWVSFLQLWTAKEAVSKLIGIGCDVDFATIEIDVAAGVARCHDPLTAKHSQMYIYVETVEAGDASYCLSAAGLRPAAPGLVYSTELLMPPSMITPAFL